MMIQQVTKKKQQRLSRATQRPHHAFHVGYSHPRHPARPLHLPPVRRHPRQRAGGVAFERQLVGVPFRQRRCLPPPDTQRGRGHFVPSHPAVQQRGRPHAPRPRPRQPGQVGSTRCRSSRHSLRQGGGPIFRRLGSGGSSRHAARKERAATCAGSCSRNSCRIHATGVIHVCISIDHSASRRLRRWRRRVTRSLRNRRRRHSRRRPPPPTPRLRRAAHRGPAVAIARAACGGGGGGAGGGRGSGQGGEEGSGSSGGSRRPRRHKRVSRQLSRARALGWIFDEALAHKIHKGRRPRPWISQLGRWIARDRQQRANSRNMPPGRRPLRHFNRSDAQRPHVDTAVVGGVCDHFGRHPVGGADKCVPRGGRGGGGGGRESGSDS